MCLYLLPFTLLYYCAFVAAPSQRIQFAVTKSHAVLKKEGKYIPLRKRKEMEGESGEGDAKRVATEPSGPKVSVPLPPPRTDTAPPNKMLLAQNLPESVTQESITEMFKP